MDHLMTINIGTLILLVVTYLKQIMQKYAPICTGSQGADNLNVLYIDHMSLFIHFQRYILWLWFWAFCSFHHPNLTLTHKHPSV